MPAPKIFKNQSAVALGSVAVVAFVVVALMPSLNASGHLSNYQLNLWGKYLCYAVVAVSLNLLWGYTGLLCLGQSLFFALGGYAFGMHLMLMIGPDPVYNSPLPDFMDFLGYTELPVHWKPFYSFWFSALAVMWVPGLLAFAFGFLVFRSRISGVYFAIITQALTYAASLLFFRNDFTFGGNNGFTDFKLLFGQNVNSPEMRRAFFMATGILLTGSLLFSFWLTRTKFGKVQQAIRDSENRVRFSGYSTTTFKLFVFVASAMMAGLAGAVYVPQVGIINPSEMVAVKSLEVVVWVAVGGRATLWGPVIGAVAVNWLKSWATVSFPDYWLIILGGIFVVVVLFMPGGIIRLPSQIMDRRRQRPISQSPAEVASEAAAQNPV
ncbi:urea ABC transporter permease subunit UrtC [soil metagenome]